MVSLKAHHIKAVYILYDIMYAWLIMMQCQHEEALVKHLCTLSMGNDVSFSEKLRST